VGSTYSYQITQIDGYLMKGRKLAILDNFDIIARYLLKLDDLSLLLFFHKESRISSDRKRSTMYCKGI